MRAATDAAPAPARHAPRRLIDAALAEFADHGLDGARIDGIVRRAGVSKQLFYYYFESKAEIYELALETMAEWSISRILDQDLAGMDAEDALRHFFRSIFDQYIEMPVLIRFTIDEDHHAGAHISTRNKLRSMTPTLVGIVSGLLTRGEAAGVFRPAVDAEFFYTATLLMLRGCFVSSCTAALMQGLHLDQRESLIRWRENCLTLAMDGIRRPAPPAEDQASPRISASSAAA